jgi:hypothetical protein
MCQVFFLFNSHIQHYLIHLDLVLRGGNLIYPLKRLQKIGHKNAIKHRNRGAPYILSQPQEPPHNNLKTTVY